VSITRELARNVSVYSVYNEAGTYYFGSDRSNPLDTGYPYANAMLGSIFAYGDDNTSWSTTRTTRRLEWYLQDTFKASRRLTFDYGCVSPGGRPELRGQHPGVVQRRLVQSERGRSVALTPGCSITTTAPAHGGTRSRSTQRPARSFPTSGRDVRHLFLCRRQLVRTPA